MTTAIQTITITINNWEKHNPRKDIKRPSWFAFDNRMIEDCDIYDLNHGEFRAWIYFLSLASRTQAPQITLSVPHASRVCGIEKEYLLSAISKLEEKQIVTRLHVTRTSRARHADVREPNATNITNITNITNMPTATDADGPAFDFENCYQQYPKKVGKSKGLALCAKQIKTEEDYVNLTKAIKAYALFCKDKDSQFIKHFSTFMHEWKDWLAKDAGKAPSPIATKAPPAFSGFKTCDDEAFDERGPEKLKDLLTGLGIKKLDDVLKSKGVDRDL